MNNTITTIEVLSVSSTQIILCWGYGIVVNSSSSFLPTPLKNTNSSSSQNNNPTSQTTNSNTSSLSSSSSVALPSSSTVFTHDIIDGAANYSSKRTTTWSKLPLPLQQRLYRRHRELEVLANQRRKMMNTTSNNNTNTNYNATKIGGMYSMGGNPQLVPLWSTTTQHSTSSSSFSTSTTASSLITTASYTFTLIPSSIDRWHIQYSPRYLGRWLEWDSYVRIPFVILTGLESNCRYIFRIRGHNRSYGWSTWIYTNQDILTLPTVPLTLSFLTSLSSLFYQSDILAQIASSLSLLFDGSSTESSLASLSSSFLSRMKDTLINRSTTSNSNNNNTDERKSSSDTSVILVNTAIRTLFGILNTVLFDGKLQSSNILRSFPYALTYFHDSFIVLAIILASSSLACPLVSTSTVYQLAPLFRNHHSSPKGFSPPDPLCFPSPLTPSSSNSANNNTTTSSPYTFPSTPSHASTRSSMNKKLFSPLNPSSVTGSSVSGTITRDDDNKDNNSTVLSSSSSSNPASSIVTKSIESIRLTNDSSLPIQKEEENDEDEVNPIRRFDNTPPVEDLPVVPLSSVSSSSSSSTASEVPLITEDNPSIVLGPILPSQPIDYYTSSSSSSSSTATQTVANINNTINTVNSNPSDTNNNNNNPPTNNLNNRRPREENNNSSTSSSNGIRYIGRYGSHRVPPRNKIIPSSTGTVKASLSTKLSSSSLPSTLSSPSSFAVQSSATYVPPTEMFLQNGIAIACQRCTRPLRNLIAMLNSNSTSYNENTNHHTAMENTTRMENDEQTPNTNDSTTTTVNTASSSFSVLPHGGRIRICSLCCRQLCTFCRCHTIYDGCVENYNELFVQRVCIDCAIETSIRFTNRPRSFLSFSSSLSSVVPNVYNDPTNSHTFLTTTTLTVTDNDDSSSVENFRPPDSTIRSSIVPSPVITSFVPEYSGGLIILPHSDLETYPQETRPTNNGLQVLSSGAALALLMAIGKDAQINLEMAIYKWSQAIQWTPGRIFKAIQEQVNLCNSIDSGSSVPLSMQDSNLRERTDTHDTMGSIHTVENDRSVQSLTIDPKTNNDPNNGIPSSVSTVSLPMNDSYRPSLNNDIVVLSSPSSRSIDGTPSLSSVSSFTPLVLKTTRETNNVFLPHPLQKSNSAFLMDENEANDNNYLLRTPVRSSINNNATDRSTTVDSVSSALTRHTITPSLHSVYMMSPSERRSAFVSSFLPSTLSSISLSLSNDLALHSSKSSLTNLLVPLLSSSSGINSMTKLLRAKVYTDGQVRLPDNHPATKLRNQLRHTSTLLEYITLLYTHRGAVTNLRITKVIAANHLARMRAKMVNTNTNSSTNSTSNGNPGFDSSIHPCVKALLVARSHAPLASLTKQARLDLTREPGIVISSPVVVNEDGTVDEMGTATVPPDEESTASIPKKDHATNDSPPVSCSSSLYPNGKRLELGDAPWSAVLKLKGKLSNMTVVESAMAGVIPSSASSSTSFTSSIPTAFSSSSIQVPSTMESRYVGLGTNETYSHMEILIRKHVQQCVRYLNSEIVKQLGIEQPSPPLVKLASSTMNRTESKLPLSSSPSEKGNIAAAVHQLQSLFPSLPSDLVTSSIDQLRKLYIEEENKLTEALAMALIICCSRTHSGGDAHAIAHDVYGGPSPMHTEPGHPIPRQLVLLRHAQPAKWPALGLAKNVIASCPPLHIIFPTLEYTDTDRQVTDENNDLLNIPSLSSLPIRVRTCDIYQVADYADLEGSTWAFLATTMTHDLRILDSNEYLRYYTNNKDSKGMGTENPLLWQGGFRTSEQWLLFLQSLGERIVQYSQTNGIVQQHNPSSPPISSSSSSSTATTELYLTDILRTGIQTKLPLLIDTERALSIIPIGREPGELQIVLLGVTGLGTVAPGVVDEEEEANDVAERLNGNDNSSTGNGSYSSSTKTNTNSSSVLQKLGLVSTPSPSTLALAIQRALRKKGLKVDVQRMSSSLSVVANTTNTVTNSNNPTNPDPLQRISTNPSSKILPSAMTTTTMMTTTTTLAQATETALREALGLGPSVFLPTSDNDLLPQEHPGSDIPLLDTASLTYVRRYGVPTALTTTTNNSVGDASSSSSSSTNKEASSVGSSAEVSESPINNDPSIQMLTIPPPVPVTLSSSTVAPSSVTTSVTTTGTTTVSVSQIPSAYVVLRCGNTEMETPSKPILSSDTINKNSNNNSSSSLSNSMKKKDPTNRNRNGERQRNSLSLSLSSNTGDGSSKNKNTHPGYAIPGWKETMTLQWDGTTAITLSLWSVSASPQSTVMSSSTVRNLGNRISTSLGSAAFSLMGLFPGLPERISVPLVTRIMVRVPVEHNNQGSCVCHENYRKNKYLFSPLPKSTKEDSSTETSGYNNDDDDDDYGEGEAMMEEEVDRFATNSTLYRRRSSTKDKEDETNRGSKNGGIIIDQTLPWVPYHDDNEDEGNAVRVQKNNDSIHSPKLSTKKVFLPTRSSFALTGQLSLVSSSSPFSSSKKRLNTMVVPKQTLSTAVNETGIDATVPTEKTSGMTAKNTALTKQQEEEEKMIHFYNAHLVEECVDIETGRLSLEVYYWPNRTVPVLPIHHTKSHSKRSKEKGKTTDSTTRTG